MKKFLKGLLLFIIFYVLTLGSLTLTINFWTEEWRDALLIALKITGTIILAVPTYVFGYAMINVLMGHDD